MGGTRGPLILGRGGNCATLFISIYTGVELGRSVILGDPAYCREIMLSFLYSLLSRHYQGRVKLTLVENICPYIVRLSGLCVGCNKRRRFQ